MARARIALPLVAAILGVAVPGAHAAVVVGMTAPTTPTAPCDNASDIVQDGPALTDVIPQGIASPVITSWSTNAAVGVGQQLALKVFEKISEPATFRQVSHDGPRALTGGALNEFTTDLPVRAGDLLGVGTPSDSAPTACIFGSELGNRSHLGFLNDGESAGPFAAGTGLANVAAVIEPSHHFTIGSIRRNRKKGTARVGVTVPGPGTLTLSGKGVRAQHASGPVGKAVSSPGTVRLLITAKGRKRKRLNRAGRVRLRVSITYTPTGGSPGSQSVRLRLRKS